jgi:hypothetical protein
MSPAALQPPRNIPWTKQFWQKKMIRNNLSKAVKMDKRNGVGTT